ncbi:MAG TPA: AAA family ATPase [Roseiarcus sp.]|jgi:class 3 adenylate cyclase/tetratricopeptide (TPR) repeat protein
MREQGPNRYREAFVDRVHELAELTAGIDGALASEGRLLMLSGEPGVGKSRLARQAAAYAEKRGVRALWGRCWEHGGAPPYWPWVQALRRLIADADPATLAGWLATDAAEIAQIAPELRERLGGLPEPPSAALAQPEKARFRLFDSVASFIRRAAETEPLLIILDDLHAADPTSIMMLIAVARQIRTMRATIIGTYREIEVKNLPELASLITEAEREGLVLPLRGLGEADIHEFVERTWGVRAAGSLVDLLRDTTEGNPFFLHEVLRQMAADGQLTGGASAKSVRLNIPRGVREFIKRLTQPLPDDAREMLDVASVLGRDFSLNALSSVTGKPPEALIDALDRAVALELITETPGAGRYSFRHALIREALYDALPAARRRALHREVAEAIRALNADAPPFAEIAYHYCQSASPADAEIAADYSRQAARAAERQLAYEEAAQHLHNAIDALALKPGGDEALEAELMCELGEAQARTGDLAEARKTCLKAVELARRLNRPEPFARAAVTAGRGVSNSGETDHELVRLLNEALDRLGDKDSPLRGQALARLGIELYWADRERSVALCQEAVEMARRLDDPRTLIVALWGRHLSLRNPDSLEQRLADGREAVAVAERAGERDFALEARFYRVTDLVEAGDIAGADLGLRDYLTAEADLKDRFKRGFLLQGMRALMDGQLAQASSLAQQAFIAGQQSGRPLTLNAFLVQHGMAMWELGRLGELEPQLRAYVTQNPAIVFARCGLQLTLVQLGRLEEARTEFESLAGDAFAGVPRDWNWLASMFVLAEICVDLGEARHAEVLYRLLAPYSARNAVIGWYHTYGSVASALGRLAGLIGRFDDAKAHFETAISANARMRAATPLAHSQYELAKLLLARTQGDDAERAHALLGSARRAAETLNLVRVKHKLARLGALDPPAPVERAPVAALVGGWAESGASVDAPSLGGAPIEPEGAALDSVAASAMSQAREVGALASLDGTVTIMFSDIVESTTLYETLGDLRGSELIRTHNEIFRREVAAHRGHEVQTFGDSFMIAFSSVRRAVLCAIAVQRAFAAYSDTHPELPIRVRIGLHVGEAVRESTDFFGRAVILAARISSLAQGGQILVSSTLHDVAVSAGDLRFSPAGERPLKGLAGTHRIYELIW